MKKIYYVVISLGEDVLIKTIESIIENCIFNFQIIVYIPNKFREKLEKYKEYKNLLIIKDERKEGIYNSMNYVLGYLYQEIKIVRGDYICFLNTGDLLNKDFNSSHLKRKLDFPKKNFDIYLFGHSSFMESKLLGKLKLRNYYPPKNYTMSNIFRGGSICHQSTYISLYFLKEKNLFFDSRFTPFSDLDLLLRCLRQKASVKTHPVISALYEGSGFSSNNIFIFSIKKLKYLLTLKEFNLNYFIDIIIFSLKIVRKLLNNYLIKNFIKKL